MKPSPLARLRAAVGLLACLAALTAVPVLLTRLGGIPTASAIRNAIDLRYLPAHLALGVAAAVAWIAYAYLLAWLATEIAYGIARQPTSRRPRPSWVHPLTTQLACLALVVVGRVALAGAEPGTPAPPPAVTVPLSPELAVARVQLSASQHHVVVAGDNLWDLAEDYYRDGFAWRRIWSANRDVVSDPRQLPIGVTLVIPGPDSTGAPGATYTVRPGDSLWSIASDNLGAGDHWPEVWAANHDRAEPGGAVFDNPSLIRPGWEITLPGVGQPPNPSPAPQATPPPAAPVPAPAPAASPTTAPAPSEPARPSGQGPVASPALTQPKPAAPTPPTLRSPSTGAQPNNGPPAVRSPAAHDSLGESDERSPVGLLGVAGTVLAVGISTEVWRRRRRRQLQLPRGKQAPVPPPQFDDLRGAIAAEADTDHAARLRAALDNVGRTLAERRSDARPRLVQVSSQRVEVLLSQPVLPAPAGWRPEASGSAWVRDGEPAESLEDVAEPCPVLVSVGRPEDGAQLYLDLEAEGIVSVCGDPDGVNDVVRSWVLELATSPLAEGVSLVVVGDTLLPDSEAWDRVRHVADVAEVVGDARAWVEQSAALLDANRWPTPVAGRVRAKRTDDLAPLVVVVGGNAPAEEQQLEALAGAIGARQVTVTLVVAGADVEGATRVDVGEGTLRVPSLGLTCAAQTVSSAVADQVGDLLEDAARVPAQLELIPTPEPRPSPVTAGDGRYQDPDYDILVHLLGEISVIGGTKALKPKQTAVFSYIALHAPVNSDTVEDAVWVAPTASRHKRLANTVSECRAALGAEHLPVAADGRYRVGRRVTTDLDLFDRRVAYAAHQDDEAAIDTLRGALELVDGPVFSYRNAERASYVWVDIGNWHSTWELKVTAAAEDLAQRCLGRGDPDGAIWATRRGLHASKTDSALTKLLINAHLAKGDTTAAAQVFESHQTALHELDLDDVDPELVEYYETARRGAAAS